MLRFSSPTDHYVSLPPGLRGYEPAAAESHVLFPRYSAPVKVTTDTERSGVWLTAAYINHSCLPTVHRIVCDNYLLVRACRDLAPGDELTDSYCEVMQPLAKRNDTLGGWGFFSTGFRSDLEKLVLEPEKVHDLTWNAACADEDACNAAEAYVVRRLDAFLRSEGAVSNADLWAKMPSDWRSRFGGLPCFEQELGKEIQPGEQGSGGGAPRRLSARTFADHLISAERFFELRYGFSKPSSTTEENMFAFQQELHLLLLASFSKLFRSYAVTK